MAITGTGEIKRESFMLFVNVGTTASPEWELIGEKVEDLGLELNPNVEKVHDVTGKTSVTIDKYEVQTSVSPMRAKKESKMFAFLYGVVKDEKTLSDLEKEFLCVNVFDVTGEGASATYAAWKQKGVVAVNSYGGGTQGLDIPYDIHYFGDKIHGDFAPATKAFTPAAA